MTTLQTRPVQEQTTGPNRRLLLLGLFGLLLSGLMVLIAATKGGGGDDSAVADPPAVSGEASPDLVAERAAGTLAAFVDAPAEAVVPAFAPEPGGSVVDGADDPVATGASVACEGFLQGGTVADFAGWFVADVGATDVAERELFRAMLSRALTDGCPEVLSARG